MELSIATDYFTSDANPEPYLKRIAEAGFSHVHWCHRWASDFLYADAEIEPIGAWLRASLLGPPLRRGRLSVLPDKSQHFSHVGLLEKVQKVADSGSRPAGTVVSPRSGVSCGPAL